MCEKWRRWLLPVKRKLPTDIVSSIFRYYPETRGEGSWLVSLVSRLRMNGAAHTFPLMSSWCVQGQFYFLGAFACEKWLLDSSCLSVCLSWNDSAHTVWIFMNCLRLSRPLPHLYLPSPYSVLMTNDNHNRYNQFFYSTVFCLLYMFRTNLVVHHQEHGMIYCITQFGTIGTVVLSGESSCL